MPMDIIQLFAIAAIVVFASVILLLFLSPFKLWLQAYMSGADISLASLFGMIFRKMNPRPIVHAKIIATQAGLEINDSPDAGKQFISTKKLEDHYLAGGDVVKVVTAIVTAKRYEMKLDFDEACQIDLSSRDVLEEVHNRMRPQGPVP